MGEQDEVAIFAVQCRGALNYTNAMAAWNYGISSAGKKDLSLDPNSAPKVRVSPTSGDFVLLGTWNPATTTGFWVAATYGGTTRHSTWVSPPWWQPFSPSHMEVTYTPTLKVLLSGSSTVKTYSNSFTYHVNSAAATVGRTIDLTMTAYNSGDVQPKFNPPH